MPAAGTETAKTATSSNGLGQDRAFFWRSILYFTPVGDSQTSLKLQYIKAMWIMTTRGFYSAVQHRDDPELIMLRARCQKDLLALKELLPELEPYSVPGSDYAWRAVISQKNWQKALVQLAAEIDYPNFKDAVKDQLHKQAYMNVWADLLVLQQWPDQD